MSMRLVTAILLLSTSATVATAQEPPRERIRIQRAEDLPRHTYPVPTTVAELLDDAAQFNVVARQLEADVYSDLAAYIIEDRATLKGYYEALSNLALLRGEYDAAVAWQDSIRAIEDKPALRMLAGTDVRALAEASRAPESRFEDAYREAFRRELSSLPFAQVRRGLLVRRQMAQMAASPSTLGLAEQLLQDQVRDGALSMTGAQLLVQMRAGLKDERVLRVLPVTIAVFDEVIAANEGIAKPEIWTARDVSLEGRDGLTPVVVAIWDSGVDSDLFPGRLFVNPGEVANNRRDDDGNGHVDDVHGIAYDLNHDRSTGVLGRTALSSVQQAEYRQYHKGQADVAAGVTSAEAQAFTEKLASIQPAEVQPWLIGMDQYQEFLHGTHVAGIAIRDNPAARLLTARNEEDYWRPSPQNITLETERKRARETRETVEYFKRSGVRVVNMSWAYTPSFFEDILAKNEAGGDAESRTRLAREMFDTLASALHSAIESAPDILFVTAAGNQDDDGRFVERIPATFDLPNLMTAAAVDYAGDEAWFTSYGKVDVYANGSDVLSFVPGGAVIPYSGTSMAAPQVVNLAAKLLALRPQLTVAELKAAIVDAADEKTIGENRRIRLLNPKASVERVTR